MAEGDELVLACAAIIAATARVKSVNDRKQKRKRSGFFFIHSVFENELFIIFSCAKTCIPNAGFILNGIIQNFVTVSYVANVNS
jgi:hypothetical protein